MRLIRPLPRRSVKVCLALMLALAAVWTGCAKYKHCIVAVSNQDHYPLTADDIAVIMTQAGFNNEQILELGPALRNALSQQGAAQFQVDHQVDALFAVYYPFVHVTCNRRGSFSYNLETHEIR